MLASPLILALAQVAPQLVMELIGIWHAQGKVTAQEVADFISQAWPDPNSFFHKKPVAPLA